MAGKVRDMLLDSAAELFARFGYDKTTVDDICARAHRTKTSVYYYFDSKRAIFKAVLEREMSHLKSTLAKYVDVESQDPHVMTSYLKDRMVTMTQLPVYSGHASRMFSLQGGEVAEILRMARDAFDGWESRYFSRLCENGRKCGVMSQDVKPDIFANMLVMLLKGVETQFFTTKDIKHTKSTYEYMVDLLVGSVLEKTATSEQ